MYITLKTSDISSYGESCQFIKKKKHQKNTDYRGHIQPKQGMGYGGKSLKISLHLHCLIPSKLVI